MKNLAFMHAVCLLAAGLCFAACATKPASPEPALPEPPAPVLSPEPEVLEPVFTITSIAVMQAELINTRFKVRVRVDNPNNFPLELSAFTYELYGGGRFWADGTETASKEDGAVMQIPPEGFAEKDLFLLMNFMTMKREVLDQIIALKAVKYRFSGDVLVSTGALPRFTMRFDRSGESPVMQ
jgi:LEA14-like dessication related protein